MSVAAIVLSGAHEGERGRILAGDQSVLRIDRYARGLLEPAPAQLPSQVDGDPQYAALVQYLTGVGLDSSDAIIDIGAGEGVVARAMSEIGWPDSQPRYVAVDLHEPLEALSLPSSIHNHSRKVEFEAFISSDQAFAGSNRHVIVIRNVFHELDIMTTARLLCAINSRSPADTLLYIQDMQELPTAESRNAPWSAHRLREALTQIGVNSKSPTTLRSRSGTPWYSIECDTRSATTELAVAGRILCEAKTRLQADLKAEYERLDLDRPENASRALAIARDVRTIELQVAAWRDLEAPHALNMNHRIEEIPLVPNSPLMISPVSMDLVHVLPDGHGADIVAVLESKDVINMASSIDAAVERVWFFGYSNKYAFRDSGNVQAIGAAAARGVDVSIVMVDPESPAALLRSAQPAYSSGNQLLLDIDESLEHLEHIQALFPQWAEVRLTAQVPPCSFFIIDDFCVASYYTSHSRGTAGRSAVYRQTEEELGFFEMLVLEYKSTRLHSSLATGGKHGREV